jgi:Na+/proline symporter
MAMCSSDANAIAAVFTRDCAPVVWRRARTWTEGQGLRVARITTVVFLGLSMAAATQVNSPTFGDIITVVIKWVAGLMGPMAIPMMLGLLRPFRRSGPTAALTGWSCGLFAFWLVNYPIHWNLDGGVPLQYQVSIPLAVSLVLYIVVGFIKPEDTPERLAIIEKINTDGDGDGFGGAGAAAAVPAPGKDASSPTGA